MCKQSAVASASACLPFASQSQNANCIPRKSIGKKFCLANGVTFANSLDECLAFYSNAL